MEVVRQRWTFGAAWLAAVLFAAAVLPIFSDFPPQHTTATVSPIAPGEHAGRTGESGPLEIMQSSGKHALPVAALVVEDHPTEFALPAVPCALMRGTLQQSHIKLQI